ncbi:7557_t:CDS:2 [Entrophospora sp. SA101]|nr:7557_t:CDS:2 [Entrophospora sp. SA101]
MLVSIWKKNQVQVKILAREKTEGHQVLLKAERFYDFAKKKIPSPKIKV